MSALATGTVLFVCTANRCRSPIAAALLGRRLAGDQGAPTEVRATSAGLLPGGEPALAVTVEVMGGRGIDLSSHRSRRLDAELVAGADLVVGMERLHVREAVVVEPSAWSRSFTLRELVRRTRERGSRRVEEPLADWLQRLHDGRTGTEMLGSAPRDDLPDPVAGGLRRVAEAAEEIERLVADLAAAAGWSGGPPPFRV